MSSAENMTLVRQSTLLLRAAFPDVVAISGITVHAHQTPHLLLASDEAGELDRQAARRVYRGWRCCVENELRFPESRAAPVRAHPLIVDFMVAASGGPAYFTRGKMKLSRAGKGVDEHDGDTFMRYSAATLEHLKVPAQETSEVLAFFSRLKADVVDR